MRKLQGYQHSIVYKTGIYPNNASYDLKTWCIKIEEIKNAQNNPFFNTKYELFHAFQMMNFIH